MDQRWKCQEEVQLHQQIVILKIDLNLIRGQCNILESPFDPLYSFVKYKILLTCNLSKTK